MPLDSRDPNDLGNYDAEGNYPPFIPEPVENDGEKQQVDESHPLIKVLDHDLVLYPIIVRWTMQNDIISHTVTHHIVLSKSEESDESKTSRRSSKW